MTKFLLLRHGTTDAIGHSFTGRLPGFPLNATGTQEARRLADHLRHQLIQNIYTSPSVRARETAAFLGETLGLPVIEDPAFCEIDVGDWSGHAFEDLAGAPGFTLFNSVRSLSRPPSGEMMIEVQSRVVAQLLRFAAQHAGRTVAIVSHADVIKAALAYFLGIPLDLTHRLEIGLCSISLLNLSPEAAQVIAINRQPFKDDAS